MTLWRTILWGIWVAGCAVFLWLVIGVHLFFIIWALMWAVLPFAVWVSSIYMEQFPLDPYD